MVALVSVTYDGSIYELVLELEPDGGTYSSGSIALSTATWYCLQVKVYRHDTLGYAWVDLDGDRKIDEDHKDTKGTFYHNWWDIGVISTNTAARVYFDEFAISSSSFPSCLSPPPAVPTGVSATDNLSDRVTVTWTKKTGATGYKIYRAGGLIDTVGDVATYDDFTAAAPWFDNAGTASASNGTFADKVRLSLADEHVNPGTTYLYKVSSLNACGESAQSTGNNGHREPGAITRQWQVDDGGGWDNIPGGTTDTYDYMDAPPPTITPGDAVASDGTEVDHVDIVTNGASSNNGDDYNYRCRVSASGAATQSSSTNTGYTGADFLTYQWQRSNTDAASGWANIDGATTDAYNDFAAPAAIVDGGTATASDGDFLAHVRLSLAGEHVDVVGRYWRCLLTAGAINETTGNNRGYRGYGAINYQWRRSAGDADNTFGNIGGATTDPYNDTGAPANGDGRWYYCTVTAAGATSDDSSHNRGYRGTLTVTTMIGSDAAWEWNTPEVSVSVCRITTDDGMTWEWGVIEVGDVVPDGDWDGWEWTAA